MDPVHFSGKEVLEMAVKIEENGLVFYTEASKETRSIEIKALFKMLAEEEGQHIKVFKRLRDLLDDEESATEAFDPYLAQASDYLKAMADTEVFPDPKKEGKRLATTVYDENDALDVAIGLEKDSLLFYYELQRMINQKDKQIVEELINQEKEHLKKLTELQQKMFGSN